MRHVTCIVPHTHTHTTCFIMYNAIGPAHEAITSLTVMTTSNGNLFTLQVLCAVIHRSPVSSPHKGQWCGALMFPFICAWTNGWINNREAGDLRRHRAHYDVSVMASCDRRWPRQQSVMREHLWRYFNSISEKSLQSSQIGSLSTRLLCKSPQTSGVSFY